MHGHREPRPCGHSFSLAEEGLLSRGPGGSRLSLHHCEDGGVRQGSEGVSQQWALGCPHGLSPSQGLASQHTQRAPIANGGQCTSQAWVLGPNTPGS